MDDLILRAALWQDEHWVDRSAMLKADSAKDTAGAAKVVLLSFDRMREYHPPECVQATRTLTPLPQL